MTAKLIFDPATGIRLERPLEPSVYRINNEDVAWMFNPITGNLRRADDVARDLYGYDFTDEVVRELPSKPATDNKGLTPDELEALRSAWQQHTQSNVDRMSVQDIVEEINRLDGEYSSRVRVLVTGAVTIERIKCTLLLGSLMRLAVAAHEAQKNGIFGTEFDNAMEEAFFITELLDDKEGETDE